MEDTNIQIIPLCFNIMWLCFIHVRLACARESYPLGSRPTQVGILSLDSLNSLMTLFVLLVFFHSLVANENHAFFRTYVIASVAGIYSLFPLLFTAAGESFFN